MESHHNGTGVLLLRHLRPASRRLSERVCRGEENHYYSSKAYG